ncbi:HNH endonuclease [bacterium D16-51]|nr:HNH endonuclease [bacterium D16-59]RKI51955.1 HNH endonuclease [bacterium D16-51]
MAILLTNGTYYIAHSKRGAVIKVEDIGKAQDFYSLERAIAQKNKTPGKCAGYYYIDTDMADEAQGENKKKPKRKRTKHKAFSMQKRQDVYLKTEGHCYLCGEFVGFDSFEVEHKIPLSKGGTNELDNLFCACHCCNSIKHDIYPEDFLEKISQIFMHQMQTQNKDSLKWRIIHNELKKMI